MIYLEHTVLSLALEVSVWSRFCDKTKTKTLTSKIKTNAKAVKICLKAASRWGTASKQHNTEGNYANLVLPENDLSD